MKNALRKRIFYTITICSVFGVLILLPLMFLLIPSTSNFTGISPSFEDIMVVPNSPIEKDGSFNEELINGAGKYSIEMSEEIGEEIKVGKITPSTIDNETEYKRIISIAFEEGGDVLTSAGFNLINALIGTADYGGGVRENNGIMFREEYKDKYFILIDDSGYDLSISRNSISVRFQASEAGFIAGIAASIYALWSQTYLISTFGGLQFSTVFDWMSGYEQGINWFNYWALGYEIEDQDGNPTNIDGQLYGTQWSDEKVKLTNGSQIVDYTQEAFDSIDWYSGSFNLGEGTTITDSQIDAGSSVIFPVAGVQTSDAINEAEKINDISKNENNYVKVIGVDTDATNVYSENEREILGSATKNIRYATMMTLWYVDRFILTYDQDENLIPAQNQLEQEFYQMISTPSSQGGWKEADPIYTSSDFSTFSSQTEIDEFIENDDSTRLYLDDEDINYYDYGQDLTYGSMFIGNYENSGVGFVATSPLDEYVTEIFDGTYTSFDQIIAIGFEQNIVIENASDTFALSYVNPNTTPNQYPWIPNWTKY